MNPKELWERFTNEKQIDEDEYEVWSFGVDPDLLSQLVITGHKTGTSSLYILYEIENEPLHAKDRGGKITDKIADNIYGTKEELENWKNFVFNNKLPLFLNIVLTIAQNNNSKEFVPWLVDKQYTDDEINKMFGFTEEEIRLMDVTLKKYERNSPWFKRYMCGKDSATDDEVNEFIKRISE